MWQVLCADVFVQQGVEKWIYGIYCFDPPELIAIHSLHNFLNCMWALSQAVLPKVTHLTGLIIVCKVLLGS